MTNYLGPPGLFAHPPGKSRLLSHDASTRICTSWITSQNLSCGLCGPPRNRTGAPVMHQTKNKVNSALALRFPSCMHDFGPLPSQLTVALLLNLLNLSRNNTSACGDKLRVYPLSNNIANGFLMFQSTPLSEFRPCTLPLVCSSTPAATDKQTHRHTDKHRHTETYLRTRALDFCCPHQEFLKLPEGHFTILIIRMLLLSIQDNRGPLILVHITCLTYFSLSRSLTTQLMVVVV